MTLRKSKSTPLFTESPVDVDEENCNYLNYIAILILLGISFLIFLISTSHIQFPVCYDIDLCKQHIKRI